MSSWTAAVSGGRGEGGRGGPHRSATGGRGILVSDDYSGAVWPFDEQRMMEASGSNGKEPAAVGLITIVSDLYQHCSSRVGEPVEDGINDRRDTKW